jgi:hypothetical protein
MFQPRDPLVLVPVYRTTAPDDVTHRNISFQPAGNRWEEVFDLLPEHCTNSGPDRSLIAGFTVAPLPPTVQCTKAALLVSRPNSSPWRAAKSQFGPGIGGGATPLRKH